MHHIIPKHAGGTDDPSNLIELTIEEHAEAHRILYETHGRWQDKMAYLCLSGQTDVGFKLMIECSNNILSELRKDPEWMIFFKQKLREGWIKRKQKGLSSPWNKGLTKHENTMLQRSSERAKENMSKGVLNNIGDVMRGQTFSDQHRQRLRDRALQRKKIKCCCGKEVGPGMYARWHKNVILFRTTKYYTI